MQWCHSFILLVYMLGFAIAHLRVWRGLPNVACTLLTILSMHQDISVIGKGDSFSSICFQAIKRSPSRCKKVYDPRLINLTWGSLPTILTKNSLWFEKSIINITKLVGMSLIIFSMVLMLQKSPQSTKDINFPYLTRWYLMRGFNLRFMKKIICYYHNGITVISWDCN